MFDCFTFNPELIVNTGQPHPELSSSSGADYSSHTQDFPSSTGNNLTGSQIVLIRVSAHCTDIYLLIT